jgi:PAS domain S-box-containing protein
MDERRLCQPKPSGFPRRVYAALGGLAVMLAAIACGVFCLADDSRFLPLDTRMAAGVLLLMICVALALAGGIAHSFRQYVLQRKEADRALRESEGKFRRLFESSSDAVLLLEETRFLDCNQSALRIFGVADRVDFCRKHPSDFSPPRQPDGSDSQQSANQYMAQAQREGSCHFEWLHVRADGTPFPADVLLDATRIEGRTVLQAVVRDITERRQADEALRAERGALRRLLQAHDQERKLIAYEIHDGLAQQLVAAIMQCEAAERFAAQDPARAVADYRELLPMLRRCLTETRRLISGVRPPVLDESGPVRAIEGLIEEIREQGGQRVEFDCRWDAAQRLDPSLENALYRIVQEGLRNACQHSRSDRVRIELMRRGEGIQLRIQDWGVGFDPSRIEKNRFGLAGILERARLLGGQAGLRTALGEGTTVTVELPWRTAETADEDWSAS